MAWTMEKQMIRTTADKVRGVIDVGHHECKLRTSVPPFRRILGICIVEIYRNSVVWRRVGVPRREQQNSPKWTKMVNIIYPWACGT